MKITRVTLLIYALILIIGQAYAAEVAVIPSTRIIDSGATFTMNVSIDPQGTAISGAQLNIAFNSSLIRVNSITEGNLFTQGGATTYFNGGKINNSAGTVINIFNIILGRYNTSNQGTFIIIDATFIGTTGTSRFNLSNVIISDHNANSVALNVSNGSVVTIISNTTNDGNSGSSGSSSGGGGGGGAGGTSGENYSNIEIKEKYDRSIKLNIMTSYVFKTTDPIISVNITGNVNAGEEINVAVEVLRNTSSFVKSPAPDTVYKNVNIWVGTYGFATPTNIKHAEITFRVPVSWMRSNSIDPDTITMMHYQGAWEPLPTKKVSESSEWVYYEASTTRFSPHAITGKTSSGESYNFVPQTAQITESKQTVIKVRSAGNEVNSPANLDKILLIAAIIFILLNASLIYIRHRKQQVKTLSGEI